MRLSVLACGVASLSLAATVSAEPPKAPVTQARQPVNQNAPVVVASADGVDNPEVIVDQQQEQQASEPAKPARHARITSCRCGDQTPGQ